MPHWTIDEKGDRIRKRDERNAIIKQASFSRKFDLPSRKLAAVTIAEKYHDQGWRAELVAQSRKGPTEKRRDKPP
jgi:hypothetical protein